MVAPDDAVTLRITGMTCASCVRRVERALSKVEGVETASVNFASETARVTAASPVGVERLVQAVEKAGYHAEEAHADALATAGTDHRSLWILAVASALAVPTIGHPACTPLLEIQSFYRAVNALALRRGRNPDAPPSLRKVTRTV